ncbi:MAG: sulfite exporter TauE/SafE family protein [Spirochaetales bacterium]|nr:sulfite exporter TauE/SafE family protein [Spirochaetales bacterium]
MQDTIIFSLAVFISSTISGMTGMGGGILLLAFMTPVFPPAILIPLHGLIQLFSNAFRVVLSYKKMDIKIILFFTSSAAFGSLLGFPLIFTLPKILSSILIAITILFFTWYPLNNKKIVFKGKFFFVGGIASFLSLFVGAVGPLTAPFFINSKLNKEKFVATKAACQIPVHFFKVIVYIISGFVLSEWITEILIAIPIVFIGSYVGKSLTGKINEKYYKVVIKIVITLLAIRMIVVLIV